MPINSRQKGARGERELAKLLTEAGFPASRGCQFSGSPDSPDVKCKSLSRVHFESKVTQKLDLYGAIEQATRDSGGRIPLVAHKRNGKPWLAIIPMDIFLRVIAVLLKDGETDSGKSTDGV